MFIFEETLETVCFMVSININCFRTLGVNTRWGVSFTWPYFYKILRQKWLKLIFYCSTQIFHKRYITWKVFLNLQMFLQILVIKPSLVQSNFIQACTFKLGIIILFAFEQEIISICEAFGREIVISCILKYYLQFPFLKKFRKNFEEQ